jgi:transposase-like protein
MSKSTISTFELFQMFPDAEAARVYMEGKRWPDGAVCPACDEAKRITTRKGGFYRCNACKTDFTVRTATIFERSHIPLHKWLYAMYLLVTSRKGISSMQLAKQIGVTQKSAWFMLQRQTPHLQGPDRMTEILKALDAITSRVLAYRPKEKGVAATKMRKQIEKAEREAKREEGE